MTKGSEFPQYNADIITLFTYRFLLDEPTDVINLSKDIDDLAIYPERIVDSYPAEWRSYVQAALRRHPQPQSLVPKVQAQLAGSTAATPYAAMCEKILRALAVCNSDNLHLIKHPVRVAVERLIK